MNIAQLKQSCRIIRKKPKRVGRGDGSGHGGTSCRGHKGQKARSGYHRRPYFEGGQMPLIRRLPKRGFSNARFQIKISIVNLEDLNKFEDGTTITPQSLSEAGLIKGYYDKVKILGNGELKRRLTIQVHQFSQSAMEKIQQAKGSWIILKPIEKPDRRTGSSDGKANTQ